MQRGGVCGGGFVARRARPGSATKRASLTSNNPLPPSHEEHRTRHQNARLCKRLAKPMTQPNAPHRVHPATYPAPHHVRAYTHNLNFSCIHTKDELSKQRAREAAQSDAESFIKTGCITFDQYCSHPPPQPPTAASITPAMLRCACAYVCRAI